MAGWSVPQLQAAPSPYQAAVLQDKPIVYYSFEESSGTVAKNDGTKGAASNATYAPGTAKGEAGPRSPEFPGFAADNRSASFDGTSNFADTGSPLLDSATAFTIELWVKEPALQLATRIGFVGQNDAVEYGLINPTTVQIWTPSGGSLNTAWPFLPGSWHHVVSVGDGQSLRTYYDGELVGTGGTAITDTYGTSSFNVNIGGGGVYDATGNFFKGQLDEVAIYTTALTEERIKAHYLVATVASDKEAPAIAAAAGDDKFTTVTVVFTEPVTKDTAGNKANYSLDGGLTVSDVKVVNSTTVNLKTSKQTSGTKYTVTAKNIKDLFGNVSTADLKMPFTGTVREKGGLKFEAWSGITGNPVQNLVDDPRYPDSPDEAAYVTSFDSRNIYPNDSHEAYGGRMHGWIVPEQTGQYEFFIRSDDASQLFLSSDDNPANAAQIAEETGCCGAFEESGATETSSPIALTAGKRYYIQALWKEGTGGDYCQVAWRKVGDATPARSLQVIPGNLLESFVSPGTFTPPTVAISAPAAGSSFDLKAPVTITASATSASGKAITKVEFFSGTKKIGEAAKRPYTITLSSLGEDVYTITAKATDTAGLSKVSDPVNISVGGQREKITLFAIDDKQVWRFDRTGTDLGTAWKEPKFDDSKWQQGKALIADEGGATAEPIRTPISRLNDAGDYNKTIYFRGHFNFSGSSTAGAKLQLRHVIDDGAVFYLNGVEISRFGIAAGPVDYSTDATSHENAWEGPFDVPAASLVSGDNVFAAEVHQSGGSSSDLVFGAELIISIPIVPTVVTLFAIDDKQVWRFDRTATDLGTAWKETKFDDSKWQQGKALIADEGGATAQPIRTPISRLNDAGDYCKTIYFRGHFNFPGTSAAGVKLKLRHVIDDGAVFYLNGVEVSRFGIAAGPVDYTTDATSHENAWEGPFEIPVTSLVPGDNVFAVEVHQSGGSSSDLVFGAELVATIPGGGAPTPPPTVTPKFSGLSRTGTSLKIEWTGGTLQSADAVSGPWADVVNAKSPFSLTLGAGAKFYRLKP
jgi:hypothetical protein